jgi:hypothetical protein
MDSPITLPKKRQTRTLVFRHPLNPSRTRDDPRLRPLDQFPVLTLFLFMRDQVPFLTNS